MGRHVNESRFSVLVDKAGRLGGQEAMIGGVIRGQGYVKGGKGNWEGVERKILVHKEAGLFEVWVNVSHEGLTAHIRPMENVRPELFTFGSGHVSGPRK